MHENVRLSVERSRHAWSCPVKRLAPSGAERARAAMSGDPAEPSGLDFGDVGRCDAVFSSSQVEQFRAPWRSRASSSGHFERPSGAERARAAVSSAPAEPSGLEQPFRASQWSRVDSSDRFECPSEAERARVAISSAPAEPSGLDVANVGRCDVFEPGRAELRPGASGGASRPVEILY